MTGFQTSIGGYESMGFWWIDIFFIHSFRNPMSCWHPRKKNMEGPGIDYSWTEVAPGGNLLPTVVASWSTGFRWCYQDANGWNSSSSVLGTFLWTWLNVYFCRISQRLEDFPIELLAAENQPKKRWIFFYQWKSVIFERLSPGLTPKRVTLGKVFFDGLNALEVCRKKSYSLENNHGDRWW